MKRASTNPIDKTTINITKTYFGALDVIKNILFGSKNLNIETLIKQVKEPPFKTIGTLSLEEFFKQTERDKIASSLNLLLSSPTKKVWHHGEKLNISKLFSKNKLSIFDLRFTGDQTEKQFVVEQILQETKRKQKKSLTTL